MRRIALIAGVLATLGTSAAALGATTDPGAPDAPVADPLQGSWTLMLDGAPAGRLARVGGCTLQAQIVRDDTGRHVAGAAPEPCTIEFGAGMSPAFMRMLDPAAMTKTGPGHSVALVRSDAGGNYALEFLNAKIDSLTVPTLERAATDSVFMKATISADRERRVATPPSVRQLPLQGFDPRTLAVQVDGKPVAGAVAGPFTVTVKRPQQAGQPPEVRTSDLPLRITDRDPNTAPTFDPWVQHTMVDGVSDQRGVTVGVNGLKLSLGDAGLVRADLAPHADGTRGLQLDATQTTIAPR